MSKVTENIAPRQWCPAVSRFIPRSTEVVAREVMAGLLEDLQALVAPSNDGNPLPWSAAENKVRDLLYVVVEVHKAIVARQIKPTNSREIA